MGAEPYINQDRNSCVGVRGYTCGVSGGVMKKKCPIRDGFAFIAPYWHIATGIGVAVVVAIVWVDRVNSAVFDGEGQARIVNIERKLDYLMYRLGHPYKGAE